MTSKEIEARSGVPRANIRYYEAEGLLTPARAKNGYREYSEEDLDALEKIKLLRRLGVTVEELKKLTGGQVTLAAVLDRRLAELGGERSTLARVEQVCGELRQVGATFETLDANAYLAALDAPVLPQANEEAWWKAPAVPPLPESDALPVCTSIPRRLFARLFDEFLTSMLLIAALALTGHNPGLVNNTLMGLAVQLVILFAEPLLLHLFGATPGKALLGLRLSRPGGDKLTYAESFTRHLLLLWYGLGLGIPIWSLVRLYQSVKRCMDGESQPWDVDVAYTAKPFRSRYAAAFLLAAALLAGGVEAVNTTSQFPPNRGDLTVAEFAENFNRQADYLDLSFYGQYVDETGAWEDLPYNGTIYANIDGWSEEKNLPFTYTVEDGRLTAVSISAERKNTEHWVQLPTDQMMVTAMAFTWARREAPLALSARKELLAQIMTADWEGFTLRQGGTVLTLEARYEGFHDSDSLGLLMPEELGGENFCRFKFTISLEE